jgi:hypothetical protein
VFRHTANLNIAYRHKLWLTNGAISGFDCIHIYMCVRACVCANTKAKISDILSFFCLHVASRFIATFGSSDYQESYLSLWSSREVPILRSVLQTRSLQIQRFLQAAVAAQSIKFSLRAHSAKMSLYKFRQCVRSTSFDQRRGGGGCPWYSQLGEEL